MPNTLTSEAICSGQLKGRVAVVTGASSGVGRAIALSLARQGAHLCAIGRDSKALEETVAAAQESAMATAFKMDLTVKENLETLVSQLDENGGGCIRRPQRT